MRDITLEDTVYFNFTTRSFSTGVPTVLAGSPVLSVLESNNATPITSGVSVSVDRASVVGLNQATVVATAANGYEAGKSYSVYISTGTVGGVSVVGEVVAQFTIQASAAAVDLANATDGLSALKTLIDAVDNFLDTEIAAIQADTDDIQTRLPAALVSGRMDASVGAMAANVMTAAAAAADLTTELQSGLATAAALTTVAGYIDTEVASILAAVDTEVAAIKAKTDNLPSDPADASDISGAFGTVNATLATISGYIDTEIGTLTTNVAAVKADTAAILDDTRTAGVVVASIAAGAITAATIAANAIDADAIAADAVTEIQSGLATAAALTTVDDFLDTEIAAIKAKTDSLTFTVAGQVDANIQYVNDVTVNGTGATGNEWGP